MNPAEIARLISGDAAPDYSHAAQRHMQIVSDLRENPPAFPFRGETPSEASKRHYWQRKMGRQWAPLDFIFAYPLISKNARACFVSRDDVEREYFTAAARKSQQKKVKKARWKADPKTRYLKVGEMIRVTVRDGFLAPYGGREGYVTALHPAKGYRVTIWPNERWKTKVRRWCLAAALEPHAGTCLPDLPKLDE